MADNTELPSGSGGDTIATDDISGVKYPRSKLTLGADGVNDGDVSGSNPMPIKGTGTAGTANSGVVTVQGIASMTPVIVDLGANNDVTLATLPDTAAGDLAAINTAVSGTLTVASHAVTNAGTFVVQVNGDALTALQLLDDAVYTAGTGTPSKGIAVMGTDGTNPQLISVDSSGNVQVDLVTANVTNAGTFAVQAAQSGTWNITNISGTVSLPTGAATSANQDTANTSLAAIQTAVETLDNAISGNEIQADVVTFPSTVHSADFDSGAGTDTTLAFGIAVPASGGAAIVPGSATDGLLVNLGSNNDVTVTGSVTANAGTNLNTSALALESGGNLATIAGAVSGSEMQVDVLTLPNVTLAAGTNTNEVVGDAAHGAAVAGNPLLVGLEGRSSDGTAVDSGDVVRALATLLGKVVTLPYALPGATWQYASVSGGVTDTSDDVARAAQGAGSRNYVVSVDVVNGHASVSTEVVIKSGSTVIWRGYAKSGGGGVARKFDPPLRGGDNEAINVTNITTGSATYFNLQGYTATE